MGTNVPLPQGSDTIAGTSPLAVDADSAELAKDTGMEIARLLMAEGHLCDEQVVYAKRVQAKLATPKTLTTVLQELAYITPEQLQQTLTKHRVSLTIGALLLELGYIGEEELNAAVNIQKESKGRRKLGEVLVEDHFIDEQKLVEVLSIQLGFPTVEPNLAEIDKELLHKATVRCYSDHNFLPVRRSQGKVLVALADPFNRNDRETVEQIFGKDFIPAICSKRTIREVIRAIESGRIDLKASAPDEKTVVGLVETLVREALKAQASDIHMEPMKDRLRIRFRIDGVLIHHKDLAVELAPAITSRIKILASADIAEKRRHQGGRILYEDRSTGALIDMRVSFYVTVWGEKTVLRILNRKGDLLNMEGIGMYPRMLERFRYDALEVPSGVVIITGPTGSGKTTTLYACVNYLNDIHISILTAEDPVEYMIDGISQCSIDPKINLTYEETLRHIVRQDPDVIVVGEIRDRFSAETSIQAALTGHKVMTTFHTEDSIGGLIRLLHMDIEAFLISSTVVCVVAQRLLRKICPDCARDYTPTPLELRRLGYTIHDIKGFALKEGRGCSRCHYTGYKGRIGVFELLILNEFVKDALLSKKTSYEIRRISVETTGLATLLEDGLLKAASGQTSLNELFRHLPRLHKPRPLPELKRLLGAQ